MKRLIVLFVLCGLCSPAFGQDLKYVSLYQYLYAWEKAEIRVNSTTYQTDTDSKTWINSSSPSTYFSKSIFNDGDGDVEETYAGGPTSIADPHIDLEAWGSAASAKGAMICSMKAVTDAESISPTTWHALTWEKAGGSYADVVVENNLGGTRDIKFKARFDAGDFNDLISSGSTSSCKVTIEVKNDSSGEKALLAYMEWDGIEGEWTFWGHYRTSGGTWTEFGTDTVNGSVYNKTYSGWLTNVSSLTDIRATVTVNTFDIDQKNTTGTTQDERLEASGKVYYEDWQL